MSLEGAPLKNQVKRFREDRGWSQQELAERTGLSRAGVSAIEIGKLVPSTVAALSLAKVFGCRVEELFQLGGDEEPLWAWPPPRESCRYWRAVIRDRTILLPVEMSPLGMVPHDGIYRDGEFHDNASFDPNRTLVLACCDPAVGLLAAEYARTTPFRMLVLSRPSRQALQLLKDGVVHAAGLHLADSRRPQTNVTAAKEVLDCPFRLLRVTNWQAGLATAHGLGHESVARVLGSDLRWIGREPGSGARQVQDELLQGAAAPSVTAKNHAEVAEAIRSGWAEAGVSIRLVAEEAGLNFIGVREEAYDLCILRSQEDDPRLRALLEVVRSLSLRALLRELPGYDVGPTGDII